VFVHWPIIVNLLGGSLIGAWLGAGWATRLKSETLYKVIAILLVVIAAVLLLGHDATAVQQLVTDGHQLVAGIVTGFCIGVVASLLGGAGGELLIPTLVLLFGTDIKLAGSLSLAVSLPAMLVGFTCYSRDSSSPPSARTACSCSLAAGSIVGTFTGGRLFGLRPYMAG